MTEHTELQRTELQRSAVIHGATGQIEAAAESAGCRPEYVLLGENGVTAFWDSGPIVLEQLAGHLGLSEGTLKGWNELTLEQQSSVMSMQAGSIRWAMDGKIDGYQFDEAFASEPELLTSLFKAG